MWSSLIEFLADNAKWVLAISLVTFVIGLVLVPIFVTRIPTDYFDYRRRHRMLAKARRPLIALLLTSIKNLLGGILVLLGLIMLITPGQGLITLLVGLMIMNYPGKYTLERWLIRRPHVLPAVNWLRKKYGHPPLDPPNDQS